MNKRLALAFALTLVCSAAPSLGQDTVPGRIDRLAPGDFLWAPQIAPAGSVLVVISLPIQRAFIYRSGIPIGVATVSTCRRGRETRTGIFTILQKQVDHRSSKHGDAPMPYLQRLTWDGVALHGGALPGYPASHGCIRLPIAFAERLYEVTRMGGTVVITDQATVPQVSPFSVPRGENRIAPGQPFDGDFSWTPERSRKGPISIVVSGRDRRVVILRNGVEIGNSPVLLDAPIEVPAESVAVPPVRSHNSPFPEA